MGHPTFKGEGTDGDPFHLSESEWLAPRLSKALVEAPVGRFDQFKTELDKKGGKISLQTDFNAELSALLGHIQQRLEGGLEEAWISQHGYALDNATQFNRDTLGGIAFYNSDEERWARAFSEMVVFAMYGGSGEAYGMKGGNDLPIYSEFPRLFPISLACQHLSTLCILSRGFPLSQMQSFADKAKTKPWVTGCGCTGSTLNYPVWSGNIKKFACGSMCTKVDEFLTLKPTPGSVVIYNPGGPDYQGQDKSSQGNITHIGSVLRVSGARVQFIDTGILIGADEKKINEGGTVDHSFLNSTDSIPDKKSLIGVGVLPAASGLPDWAERMAAARSIGFVRLAVVDTSLGIRIRFVSKLLPMRYPISRLIWSLRGLPIEGLSVLWLVYIPRYSWSPSVVAPGAEERPPVELLSGTGGALHLTHVLRGDPNGKVRVFRRKTTTTEDGFVEGMVTATAQPINKMGDAMGVYYPMRLAGNVKLEAFCMAQPNIGLRYVDAPGDAPAVVDNGKTGVTFFDPD